jgi:DNA-binding NarL/FixJ family response regulator
MTGPIRLFLIDADTNVRRGLQMRLSLAHDIAIAGEAAGGLAAMEQVRRLRPDVVLLDLNLPGMEGLRACSLMRSHAVGVVILSLEDGEQLRALCIAAGAAALVSKHDSVAMLLGAIRSAARGTHVAPMGQEEDAGN